MIKAGMAENQQIVKASLRFVRQTARKMRRSANLIRKMKAGEALKHLGFMPYAAATPIKKLLKSAMANASNNFSIEDVENLYISQILIDDGSVFKRWRAASKGRGVAILKRSSKASIVLSEMNPAKYSQYVFEQSPRNKINGRQETKPKANGLEKRAER